MKKQGLTVYLKDDVSTLSNPEKPTYESVKAEMWDDQATDEEIKEELKDALKSYNEDIETYISAESKGYVSGMLFETNSYHTKTILVRIIDKSSPGVSATSIESKKMDECTTEEKIVKIQGKEIRKKEIQNNKLFEELSNTIKETDYITTKKALTNEEMIAFCFSALSANVDWSDKSKFETDFKHNKSQSMQKVFDSFKKSFKKEIFNKLVRYMIVNQLHFGERNHTNEIVNKSFYEAMQSLYKKEIEKVELNYKEEEQKREARLKDRITELEKEQSAVAV